MSENKKDETLFDKAVQNLNCAVVLYNSDTLDEVYLDYVGFHLQQTVELLIKFILEVKGIEYRNSYKMEQLILLSQKNNVNLFFTDYIYDKVEMLSAWKMRTRKTISHKLERNKVKEAITEVIKYLDIIDKYRKVISDDDKVVDIMPLKE